MKEPVVVNKYHLAPGGISAPDEVYIGRPSKWGNPYPLLGRESNRQEVIARYREHILKSPELLRALPELEGKTLVCFCKPKACHGDVLVELFRKHCLGGG